MACNVCSLEYIFFVKRIQLKNMINALHSSRENGTKAFEHKGSTFGWIDIYKMWMRECERKGKGHARMVPKLRETHIIRDSWTKLNVSPAKIMQVHTIELDCP